MRKIISDFRKYPQNLTIEGVEFKCIYALLPAPHEVDEIHAHRIDGGDWECTLNSLIISVFEDFNKNRYLYVGCLFFNKKSDIESICAKSARIARILNLKYHGYDFTARGIDLKILYDLKNSLYLINRFNIKEQKWAGGAAGIL